MKKDPASVETTVVESVVVESTDRDFFLEAEVDAFENEGGPAR